MRKIHILQLKLTFIPVLMITPLYLMYNMSYDTKTCQHGTTQLGKQQFEQMIREHESRIAYHINDYIEGVAQTGGKFSQNYSMDVFLSDMLPFNRTIRDFRHYTCTSMHYDENLPHASIIVTFRDEPFSVIVRTIWSILNSLHRDKKWYKHLKGTSFYNSSHYVYLKEILLVDDKSTSAVLKGKLEHYIATRFPKNIIKLFQLPAGMNAKSPRQWAARSAIGEVVVFLQGHCEVNSDWLRPLLHRIKQSRVTVVVPMEDRIDFSTFEYESYLLKNKYDILLGSFTFDGQFHYTYAVTEKPESEATHSPWKSPTMSGSMFAVDRNFYCDLFNEPIIEWGGENLEMSFKIWMCGGEIETVPCSRVGHLEHRGPVRNDTFWLNTAVMVATWMGDFKELFFMFKPKLRKLLKDIDLNSSKLKCNDFYWYLQNVYRDKFIPIRDGVAYGRIFNKASNLCLDTLDYDWFLIKLRVNFCQPELHPSQFFALSKRGEIRDEHRCAELQFKKGSERKVIDVAEVYMSKCLTFKKNQMWRHLPFGQLQHVESGLCLDSGWKAGELIRAKPCSDAIPTMKWDIDYNRLNSYGTDGLLTQEHEYAIRKLTQKLKAKNLTAFHHLHSKEMEPNFV